MLTKSEYYIKYDCNYVFTAKIILKDVIVVKNECKQGKTIYSRSLN